MMRRREFIALLGGAAGKLAVGRGMVAAGFLMLRAPARPLRRHVEWLASLVS
jgi:hypothetical protein